MNPAGTRAYVANENSANVSVIDTTTNSVVATVAVGGNPAGVGVHPAGTRAYVANRVPNTVSVIDTATNALVGTVAVQADPIAFGLFIGGPFAPTVPCAPTIGTATPGIGRATISFTPACDGGSPITSFTATCTAGVFSASASGPASPITVTGLTNNTTYSCSVTATNTVGTSAPSAPVSVTTIDATTIPTLSEWAMILLAMSLGLLGVVGVRRMHG